MLTRNGQEIVCISKLGQRGRQRTCRVESVDKAYFDLFIALHFSARLSVTRCTIQEKSLITSKVQLSLCVFAGAVVRHSEPNPFNFPSFEHASVKLGKCTNVR